MELIKEIMDVCNIFGIEGDLTSVETLRDGHINTTNVAVVNDGGVFKKYLVQGINTHVFKYPDRLMDNVVGVTSFLRDKIAENGGDPDRETLSFLPAKDGKYYYFYNDKCWRVYRYIDDAYTINIIKNASVFENAGRSFGRFQKNLSGYPMESLYETIKDFHNTPKRLENLKASVAADVKGRASEVQPEIDFALARAADTKVILKLYRDGLIPLRVTHNDTKLNNILFDKNTKESICVIDLDTIMPGFSLYDFGDAIRFGANTAAEDEKNLDKVQLSLPLFESFTRGFLSTCATALTRAEVKHLAFGAKMMTYECGIRFLADYLDGDVYFKIRYDDHNLVRARNQFKLVEEMEKHMDEMNEIVDRIYKEYA